MQPVTFIPEDAPFTAHQRLWLNGYVAGLIAGRGYARSPGSATNADAPSATATVPVVILFGSQTGTAEKLARQIAKESKGRNCAPRVVDASAHASVDWSKEQNLLVVTSTYGDGDMPDNAQGFWDWLQTDAGKAVAHLNYSVLALGDTSYEHFCAAGKKIDTRLAALGGKCVHPLADCDLDYEAKAKAWMDGVLSKLQQSTPSVDNGSATIVPTPAEATDATTSTTRTPASAYTRANPFPARLVTNRRLNLDGSEKETRHFEISLAGSDLNYEAGDALGLYPSNCPELVEDLLRTLGADGEEAVPGPGGELPLRKALTNTFDITKPTTELLQRVAAQSEFLRDLLLLERRDDLKKWLYGREVIDVLQLAQPSSLKPTELVALLKKLSPRLYSISSSPKAHAGQVHLTINIVRHASHGRVRKGVASTFLADRAGGSVPVPVFIQTSHNFRLPTDGSTPIVMVGPGTGVAPFRAFLHERRAAASKGRNWLLFGEQRAATDFYYRDELETMLADGHLTRLDTAFSRDQAEKVYVQHRLLEHAAEMWRWLQDGAHFYVCGDASRMAKDVDAALHRILETAGGKSADEARAYVAELKAAKRYQRDVY